MITASDLIREARALNGVPWVHLGRTQRGVDCIGLVILAARNAGLDLFGHIGLADRRYGRKADQKLFNMVRQYAQRTEVEPGALLLFRFDGDSTPRHFGIATERDTVIHAECKSRKQVVEHGLRSHWARWVDSAWRIPGVRYF